MTSSRLETLLKSAEATAAFARRTGALLVPGDCLLLNGPIGAGKTHFARHLIQSRLTATEDVPSPTFTLVQTYETDAGEIWHADLYRLSHSDEVDELGLTEAFDTAICLVEWPDKLGPHRPDNALTLSFEPDATDENARRLTLEWSDPKWTLKLDKLTDD